jgi:hypothetical protein
VQGTNDVGPHVPVAGIWRRIWRLLWPRDGVVIKNFPCSCTVCWEFHVGVPSWEYPTRNLPVGGSYESDSPTAEDPLHGNFPPCCTRGNVSRSSCIALIIVKFQQKMSASLSKTQISNFAKISLAILEFYTHTDGETDFKRLYSVVRAPKNDCNCRRVFLGML